MNTLVIVETFLAFVIALSLHEAAHASMAALLGDGSARDAGRLSLNPRRHMASIGTIVAIALSFGIPLGGVPVGLGWGKPVEVDTRRMRVSPDGGVFLVAIAGPLFSLLMGVFFAIILRFMPSYESLSWFVARCDGSSGAVLQLCLSHAQPFWLLRLEQFVYVLAATNILVAIVNLIPLHPLDGYDILFALLPNGPAVRYRDFKPFMELILLVIFFLIPLVANAINLPQLNPGFWLSALAHVIASALSGPTYFQFVYNL